MFVYMCAFFGVCVQVEALRRTDHPSKESYRLPLIKKLRKLSPKLHKREQAPKRGSNEEGKINCEAPHYAVSFTIPPCLYPWAQILSLA
jgi:hypothetical protein